MYEKILFVNSNDRTLALSNNGEIFELGGFKEVSVLPIYFDALKISKVGVYDLNEETEVIQVASTFDMEIFSVSEIIINNYYTDLLPKDVSCEKWSAFYMGVYNEKNSNAFLIGKIYQAYLEDKQRKDKLYSKIKTFNKVLKE